MESDIKTLVSLGLSGTQAKICLTLTTIGISTIREISLSAKVARPDTYRAVVELEHAGFVEKIVSVPSRYRLLPLKEILSILTSRRDAANLQLQNDATKLLEVYEAKTKPTHFKDNQFIVMPSGRTFFERLRQFAENSKTSIILMADQKTIRKYIDEIQKISFKNNIKLKLLTEKQKGSRIPKRLFRVSENASLDFRYTHVLASFTLIIFDSEEMVLSNNGQSGSYGSTAVCTSNASLIELGMNFFENAWSLASEPSEGNFRRTKRQFDYLFSNMINGFAYCKIIFNEKNSPIDFVYLQVNQAFEHITGLSRNKVIGKNVTKVIPEIKETHPELFEIYGRVAKTRQPESVEVYFKPLSCWLHISVYSPNRGYFAAVFEDITERKKAEEALATSEQRFRTMADGSPIIMWIANTKGETVFVNQTYKTFFGVTEIAVGEQNWKPLVHENDARGYIGCYLQALKEQKAFNAQARVKRHDGAWRWVDSHAEPYFSPRHEFLGHIGVTIDITERKQAQEALEANERKYREMINAMPHAVWIISEDCTFLDANNAALQTYEYSLKELLSMKVSDLDKTLSLEEVHLRHKQALTGAPVTFETQHTTKHGKILEIEITLTHITYKGKEAILSVTRDVSERKRAEQKNRQGEETA